MTFKEFVEEGRIIKTQTHGYILYRSVGGTKLCFGIHDDSIVDDFHGSMSGSIKCPIMH